MIKNIEGVQNAKVMHRDHFIFAIVFDDMVRTGTTIVQCCEHIKKGNPNRVCFGVTHFHTSPEAREKLNSPAIDEILTTSTLPDIMNRDCQGRLRKKLTVMKLRKARWRCVCLDGDFKWLVQCCVRRA